MRLWMLGRRPTVHCVPLLGRLSCTKPLRVLALAGFHPHVYGLAARVLRLLSLVKSYAEPSSGWFGSESYSH